ncbi:MAG: hypothetical protein ACRDZ1_03855 [Acidimicrobiia bacterium]
MSLIESGNGLDARPRLLAALPRGEAIRNFVYSGILDAIAESVDLEVATVLPNDELAELLRSLYGDILPLEPWRDRWGVGAIRELLDLAHGRWVWSEAAQERWRLRNLEATTARARVNRAAKRTAARVLARPSGLSLLERAYDGASARWPSSRVFRERLAASPPSLVFNASQVHGETVRGLITAARSLAIPTAAFLFSWDNLTSQGRIIPSYDCYLAWSETMRDDLLRMYPSVDPAAVFVTGTPQFDAHFRTEHAWSREEYCGRIGADPERPIVLYSTGMPNHMPGEPSIVEGIADRLARRGDLGRPQLVVRVYAKDRTGRFHDLARRRPDIIFPPVPWEPNWLTPLPEDTALWSNILRHADVGINVASTVSLELCMFDRPVVNVGYNPPGVPTWQLDYSRYYRFDHYRPVVASGAVEVASSPDSLMDAVAQAISRPSLCSPMRQQLLARLFGEHLDGKARQRVAERLVELTTAAGSMQTLRRSGTSEPRGSAAPSRT